MKDEIKILAAYRAGRSQYSGEHHYQVEAMVNGVRIVDISFSGTKKTDAIREFKRRYSRINVKAV